jgi:ribosomal protein S26
MYKLNSISGGKCEPSNVNIQSLNKLYVNYIDKNNNKIHLNIFIKFNDTILNSIDEFDINICITGINITLLYNIIQTQLFTYITNYDYDEKSSKMKQNTKEISLYKTLKDHTFFEIIYESIENKTIKNFYLELISPILKDSSSLRRISLDGVLNINKIKHDTYNIFYNINNITSIDPFGVKYLKYTKLHGYETENRKKERLQSMFQSPSPVKNTYNKDKTSRVVDTKTVRNLFGKGVKVLGGTCSNIDDIYDDTNIKSTKLINQIDININKNIFKLSINILFHALKHNDEFDKSYCIDINKTENVIKYKSKTDKKTEIKINKWYENSSASIGDFYNLIKDIIMEEKKYECKTIGLDLKYNKNLREYIQIIYEKYKEKNIIKLLVLVNVL